jgi:hypothetical protein
MSNILTNISQNVIIRARSDSTLPDPVLLLRVVVAVPDRPYGLFHVHERKLDETRILQDRHRFATSQSVNKVNGIHSFIKERNRRARGFATSYLNRCNALFSKIFANRKMAVDEIYKLMTRQDGHFNSISDTRTLNLLTL